jgi:hypothetical protein
MCFPRSRITPYHIIVAHCASQQNSIRMSESGLEQTNRPRQCRVCLYSVKQTSERGRNCFREEGFSDALGKAALVHKGRLRGPQPAPARGTSWSSGMPASSGEGIVLKRSRVSNFCLPARSPIRTHGQYMRNPAKLIIHATLVPRPSRHVCPCDRIHTIPSPIEPTQEPADLVRACWDRRCDLCCGARARSRYWFRRGRAHHAIAHGPGRWVDVRGNRPRPRADRHARARF